MAGVICFVAAGIALALMVFAPALVRLRIRILRAVGLIRLAGHFDRNFAAWVLVTRVAMAVAGAVLVALGLRAV
jgi:hypothetical protein